MIAANNHNKSRGGNFVRIPAEKRPAGAPPTGFTIIEVLLALAIFSIGLLAVAGMQTSSVTNNTASKMNTMAVEYAAQYMEGLLGLGNGKDLADPLGYPHLDQGGPYAPEDFIGEDFDGDGDDDIQYNPDMAALFNLTWSVADVASGSGLPDETEVKRIDMTITWASGKRTISMSSIKGESL